LAQPREDAGTAGASLYRDGKFEEAASAYRQALAADPGNPYLHYNLGNAFFKSGKPGSATASYARAFRLMPRDADIRYNLDYAMKRAGEHLVPPGVPDMLHVCHHWLSEGELKGLSLLLMWISLLLASAWMLIPAGRVPGRASKSAYGSVYLSRKKLSAPLAVSLALCAACTSWLALRSLTAISNPAVVTESSAELRSGPGENFTVSATLPEGRTVSVFTASTDDKWLEVGIPKEGLKGWVRAGVLEKL
ncbi:MAG: tetratricopeptide repeat protein, partial [bacterium]